MSDWVTLKDSLGLTFRPIDAWPGKLRNTWSREKSPYSAPLKDTLAMLKRELGQLQAKRIVLQIALKESGLRLDGLPRAAATAEHPGVILVFESKYGFLRLSFDRFAQWQYNLRAIALHLAHLRLAGLYGVGSDGEQSGLEGVAGEKHRPIRSDGTSRRFQSNRADDRGGYAGSGESATQAGTPPEEIA